MPSCEADVGILIKGFFKLFAVIFPISIHRPPPIPTMISIFSFFISFSMSSTLWNDASPAKTH